MNPSAPNSFCDGLSVGVGKVERETHKAVACRHSLQLLCGRPDGEEDHILRFGIVRMRPEGVPQ